MIDFGIAKATDQWAVENTLLTQFGQMVGTPEYASPEQAEMMTGDVDETSDVYSLGVLLVRIADRQRPFRRGHAAQRRFGGNAAHHPRRRSAVAIAKAHLHGRAAADIAARRQTDTVSLRRLVNGDLNWITMKALEKARGRRYASVSDLAADIQRHIEDRPVLASPPGRLYRARKFLRRHRLTALGTAAGVVFLALSGVTAWSLLHRAAPGHGATNKEWEQLTFFTDSAVYPALSPDGRMLAFIRGGDSFIPLGEVNSLLLAWRNLRQVASKWRAGPAYQRPMPETGSFVLSGWLTHRLQHHRALGYMGVPALGGDPHLLLPNSSSLTWIEAREAAALLRDERRAASGACNHG